MKERFSGASLCGPKSLECYQCETGACYGTGHTAKGLEKCDDWETGQEGKRQRATQQIPSGQAGQRGDKDQPQQGQNLLPDTTHKDCMALFM